MLAQKCVNGVVQTAGGRVISVTATGDTLNAAIDKAYAGVKSIEFRGMHYRNDIGRSLDPRV